MSMTSGLVHNNAHEHFGPSKVGFADWLMSHSRQVALGGCIAFWAIVATVFAVL